MSLAALSRCIKVLQSQYLTKFKPAVRKPVMAAVYDDHPSHKDPSVVPFSDHAFTMYLKSILLGYCKIGFLVTAKSEGIDVPDSLISLKYGSICALNQTIER